MEPLKAGYQGIQGMEYQMEPQDKAGVRPGGSLDQLTGAVSELHDRISKLEAKLTGVRFSPVGGPDAVPQEEPMNQLHSCLLMIEHANRRLLLLADQVML